MFSTENDLKQEAVFFAAVHLCFSVCHLKFLRILGGIKIERDTCFWVTVIMLIYLI
jgi:hypothetical protein